MVHIFQENSQGLLSLYIKKFMDFCHFGNKNPFSSAT